MTPRYTPGKMLQQYSVRLQIYSWFMKYCHPKIDVCGVIAAFPVVTLVGTNKQFLAPLLEKAQIEVYRQCYEQNRNWYSLVKQANLALFSCLC